jgi:hypothetical protein
MTLSRKELEFLNNALSSIQADLEAHKVMLQCFLVNMMAATGRFEMLDQLLDQAKFLVEERTLTGIAPEQAAFQRAKTIEALERLTADTQQARAAMERVEKTGVN